MKKTTRRKYTDEFKDEAVKLVTEQGYKITEAARNLDIHDSLLRRWIKAPGSAIHHQHGNKPNRHQYARGQCWVTLALSISTGLKQSAIPLLSRLMRTSGNSTKIDAAKLLLRITAPVFAGQEKVVTLVDSWVMKWPYLEYVLSLGFHAIGQVRYDTALFGIPVLTGKRGRPRKLGDKYTPEVVAALPETR